VSWIIFLIICTLLTREEPLALAWLPSSIGAFRAFSLSSVGDKAQPLPLLSAHLVFRLPLLSPLLLFPDSAQTRLSLYEGMASEPAYKVGWFHFFVGVPIVSSPRFGIRSNV